jgi:hypothetical protein
MNHTRSALSILVLSAFCIGAQAQQGPTTREQVRSELARAQRSGDVMAPGDTGLTLREMYPARYGVQPTASTLTRAQVKADYAEAVRTGDLVADGESGQKLNELHPSAYPGVVFAQSDKTRAQVKLEYAEAVRTGDIVDGETGLKLNEIYPARYAAARAPGVFAQRAGASAGAVSR